VESVERIIAGDRESFVRAERDARPVVIEGGARDCRATRTWSVAYLTAAVGSVRIRCKRSRSHAHPDFGAATLAEMFAGEACTFAELLDAITAGPPEERPRRLFTGDERFVLQRRAGVTTIDPELRPLLDDVGLPDLVPAERLHTVWAWMSGRGVRTWLHYDNNGCHNLNAQITGEKRCTLYTPELVGRLRPFPLGGANPAHNCSQIDVEDAEAGLAEVPCLEATIRAGDLLFIPAWWLHTFVHLGEFNTNMNFWWKPEHPLANPVADRERLLALVRAAGIDATRDDPAAALARRLDALALTSS
jgi:lysine-specific demethylase 8